MARIAARNAAIVVHDNTAASQAVSGRSNNVTLSWTSEAPEVTSFTEGTRTRVPGGLLDYEVSFDAFYDEAAGQVDSIFSGLLGGSGTWFALGPAGSTAAMVKYSGCVILTQYDMTFAVADAGQCSVTLVPRSGSLTRGVWS